MGLADFGATVRSVFEDGPVARALREYVAARVRRGGKYYERGKAAELAAFLGRPSSWISEYADLHPPLGKRRTADLDTALAICEFFRVDLTDLVTRTTKDTSMPAPTPAEIAIKRLTQRLMTFDPARVPELVQNLLRTLRAWEAVLAAPHGSLADSTASRPARREGVRRTTRER